MGRAPCCEKVGLKRGRWTAEEDDILTNYILSNGQGSWRSLPKNAGLLRCGKSCRLRWINYLRSDLKRGNISRQEEDAIIKLHASLGNKWSLIAGHLPGRTDNEIKNYWNSHLSKKIQICEGTTNEIIQPSVTTMENVKKNNNVRKRRGGRTSRFAMKRNRTYLATIGGPKLLEQKKKEKQALIMNDDVDVSMPLSEQVGWLSSSGMSWHEEVMGNNIITLEQYCPIDEETPAPNDNIEEDDEQMQLYLKDIIINIADEDGDGDEVKNTNTNTNTNGCFLINKLGNELENIIENREGGAGTTSSKCGSSATSSTNSNLLINIEDQQQQQLQLQLQGNLNFDLDDGAGNFEGDQILSWLWDVTNSTGEEEISDCEKQNAMVAWLLS